MTPAAYLFSLSLRSSIAGMAMLSLWLIADIATAAPDPEIHVATSAEEIFVGDSIDFQVEIRNVESPSAPDMSAIKEQFDVVSTGDESRNQTSISIVNGRRSDRSVLSHIYQFRLTPRVTGELTIPSAKVATDGKSLTSSPVPLRVIAAEEQDLVIVEMKASQSRVYPTQPFTVTLRILIQPLPNDASRDPMSLLRRSPPHLQVNWVDPPTGLSAEEKSSWLQPLLSDDGIGFTLNDVNTRSGSFFDGPRAAVFNLSKGREFRDGLEGRKIRYFVYELSRRLTPEKTGVYSLGPALVKGMFVAGIERKEYTAKRLVASSPAVSVEVREVPSPRPATFCGGIGEYQVTASVSPTKLRVGDPLTLTLDLKRGSQSGSLELISAPDLSAIPQLAADFDLIDKSPTGRVEGPVKHFAYALRPKRATVSIPSLTILTFDPQSEEFIDLNTATIPLDVTEAERVASGDLVGTRPAGGSTAIKSRAQGIFQNITDLSELRDQRINLVAWSEVALGVWLAAGCLIAMVTLYRRKTSDAGWVRRQQARREANRKLADARTLAAQGQSKDAMRQVRSAIVGLIADFRNRVAEGLTTTDVEATLSSAPIADEDRAAILQLLESIESAEYGAGQSADPTATVNEAAKLIARISPRLERGT